MAEPATQDTLLRELRRLNLYPPEKRQLAELRHKIEEKWRNPEESPDKLDYSKYGVLLYGLALKGLEEDAGESPKASCSLESEDSVTAVCLDNLAVLGLFGKNLAARILCNRLLPFSRVKAWFSEQTDNTAVAIADRILAVNDGSVPERVKFAESILEKAAQMNLGTSSDFFRTNGTRKGQMSFTTLEKFMAGKFGQICQKGLRTPDSLDEITICTDSMPPYPDNELVEDVSFHLRTMDPIIMEKVLRAIGRLADELDDTLLKEIIPLTQSPSLPLAKAAMDVLAKFGNSKRGRIFAQIFNENHKIRAELLNRLPLLSSESFSRFMNDISNKFHAPVLAVLFSTLSEEDPQCFGNLLGNVLKQSRSKKKDQLKPILARIIRNDTLDEPERPKPPEGKIVPGLDFVKQGGPIVLNIEKKDEPHTGFNRIFGKPVTQSDALPEIFTDGQISNQRLHKLNKWKSQSSGITFQNTVFSACDFKEALMSTCSFKGCSFESCTFTDAVLQECDFTDCTFSGCSLGEALFYDCSFKKCLFRNSHLDSATTFLGSFALCEFNAIAAPGAYFCRTKFTSSTFNTADFRESFFYKGIITGCNFSNSDFETALFRDGSILGAVFPECNTCSSRAINIRTDSPELLKAMNRTLADRLAERERLKKKASKFTEMDEYCRGIIYKTIKRWYALKDIDRNHGNFAENNSRRLSWATEKMDDKAKRFLQIMPALLHTNVFEKKTGIEDSCVPSRICGYNLSLDTIKLLEEIFPEIKFETGREESLPIEAFMSIGSTGTIAQTKSSDIDCWVCCDFSGRPSEDREKLAVKLTAIEEWAMTEFGLEIHFFIMDTKEVRNNLFGLSDAESSGSAQSAILKEEFYRTALLLAGRPPLWWFTPVECNDKVYADNKKKVAILKGADFSVDLGNVPNIPVEEFFGASLWQIVKGVKSPFKSIMKFGLLEFYTSGSKYSLLCEKLKKNVLHGMRSLRRIDPYMLLYGELAAFYKTQKQPENIWLTAMALRLKCGLVGKNGISGIPSRPEERELLEFTLNLSGCSHEGCLKDFRDLSDFRSVVALGKQINQFMIRTYMKVRGEQDRMSGIAITPEDLTKLGRVIFSSFAKRKNKIERITLPGSRTHFFNSIAISRIEKSKVWEIHGEYPDESGARNILTRIESDRNLNFMLVWLGLNGLYDPEMKIKTDLTSAPLRDRELKKLFNDLTEFFPQKKVFNADIEETLKPERITRAYFIVNLCVPREQKKVKEVHLVYGTNWGEVFCKQLKVSAKLVETPEQFLQSEMEGLCSGEFELGQFVPQNSECPYLKIPVGFGKCSTESPISSDT